MWKSLSQSFRLVVATTLLFGVAYPAVVTLAGKTLFPREAAGSIVLKDGQPAGSALFAQKFEGSRYFWPRPSAGDYATVASGASNLGPSSQALKEAIDQRAEKIVKSFGDLGLTVERTQVPAELLMASGSGLDPHLSPEAARFQLARVAKARGLDETGQQQLQSLVDAHTEAPQYGIFGKPRVNVLMLNLALESRLGP